MYPRHTSKSFRAPHGDRRFGRPSHQGGSHVQHGRGGSVGFRGTPRGRKFGEFSDISKFVNKALITEQAPHFVPEHAFNEFNIEEKRKENILIVVPTRELAIQIDEELRAFTRGMKIFSAVCVGGSNMGAQIRNLRYQNNFIIGTPGRLKDLIEQKYLDLSVFKTVVLDEADRMLDMGFINDMKFMMGKMPKERHTLFFSATMSREIESLIRAFLREPVSISVKTGDTAKNVEQDIVKTKGQNKLDVLHNLLGGNEFKKVLVFGRTKHGVEKLSKLLAERGIKAESIHGNKNLSRRRRALDLFKKNHVQVLVATDVAAPPRRPR